MPTFPLDLEQVARAGKMEERQFVEVVESLLKILTSAKAKRVLKVLRIDLCGIFSELNSDGRNDGRVYLGPAKHSIRQICRPRLQIEGLKVHSGTGVMRLFFRIQDGSGHDASAEQDNLGVR